MTEAPEKPAGVSGKPPTAKDVRRAQAARRKAERKEFRRFTVSTRKRRANAIAATGSLVALVLTVVIVTTSPVFSLQTIEVEGVERLSETELRGSLSELMGRPLAQIGAGDVAEMLAQFPLIQSVETRVDLPNTLVISLVERTPLGVVQTPTGFDVVDRAAVVLWSDAVKPTDLPIILVAPDIESAPFRAVTRALEVLPPVVLARVDAVTANSQDTVRFSLQDSNHIVLWGSAELSEAKARALPAALQAAGSEGAKLIDLSTPDTVVIRDVG